MRFGRLKVLSSAGSKPVGNNKYHLQSVWNVICDCGKTFVVIGHSLKNKFNKSCGCLRSELASKSLKDNPLRLRHGLARAKRVSKVYTAWRSMRRRCTDPKYTYFSRYGGRGISVCPQWSSSSSFEQFLKDMGHPPSKAHSLDRFPNPDGNYEPGNCRWATPSQQRNNHSKVAV